MVDIVNLLVNNGIAVVVVGYFLYTNYKFNDKLTSTLTEITVTLKDIQDDLKGVKKNDVSRHQETD
jgi:hypothetical protein